MSTTATARVFNFSSGPAVMPVPVLEEIQRDLVALPGVGMSILEISHRSKIVRRDHREGRSGHPRAGGRPVELQGAVPAGRRQPAVLDGADEPADARARPPTTSSPASWADKAVKEAKKVGTVNVAATTKADNFSRIPDDSEIATDARRGVRAHDLEQHDRGHGVARGCRRSATRRSSATPRPTCSAGRSTSRSTG